MLVTPFALVMVSFGWTAIDRWCPSLSPSTSSRVSSRLTVVTKSSDASQPDDRGTSGEGTMALDPDIRDLLQTIEEALTQQPAAD